MARVPRVVRNRKRKRVLEVPRVMGRDKFEGLVPEARVELIRELIPLGLMHIQEELDRDVERLAGRPRSRATPYDRYGTNPGSVKLLGQRIAIRVPRVRGPQGEVPLASYGHFHQGTDLDEGLFRRVLYGISCRNYEAAADQPPVSIAPLVLDVLRLEHRRRLITPVPPLKPPRDSTLAIALAPRST